jgi:PEP-CTERM motif
MYRLLLCSLLCLFLYSSAKADTFTLTSGQMFTGFDFFNINASGPNISIGGGAAGESGNRAFATCTFPCGPGSILNVGGTVSAAQLNIGFSPSTVTLNGVTFPQIFFTGQLTFTGSAVLPSDFVPEQPFRVPFTMQGQLIGFAPCPGTLRCNQVFDITVTGSGIATASFLQFGRRTAVYLFSPAVEPVPEPATLGLLGIGLSAVFAKVRRRHRKGR